MAGARPRTGLYAVLAVVGVVAVLWFWSSSPEPEPSAGSSSPAASEERVPAQDGATVAPGETVEDAAGFRYRTPTAELSVSKVLVVEQAIQAPQGDGTIEVDAPRLTIVVDGVEVPAMPDDDARTSLRTSPGGLVAFSSAFVADEPPLEVEVGDEVTVRVQVSDGTVYDVAGVAVEDGRRSRRL